MTDEWVNRKWSSHTVEYYLTLKMKEMMTATTRVILESIMLNEMSGTKRQILYDSTNMRSLLLLLLLLSRFSRVRLCATT